MQFLRLPLGLKFSQPLHGKDDVDVLVGVPMVVVVVRNHQILDACPGRDLPKGGISIPVLHIIWRLRPQVNTGSGNQCNPRILEIFTKGTHGVSTLMTKSCDFTHLSTRSGNRVKIFANILSFKVLKLIPFLLIHLLHRIQKPVSSSRPRLQLKHHVATRN